MTIPTHAELNAATGYPAFIDELEIPLLCRATLSLSPFDQIVEIGCAWGGSTVLFLINLPINGSLLSIDPFVRDSMATWQANEGECRTAVLKGLHAFNNAFVYDDWNLEVATSAEARKRFAGEINLLYIDGAHDYASVQQDFDLWSPLVSEGGLLLLHDSRQLPNTPADVFAQGYGGPTALANKLRSDNRYTLVEEAFSLTVWRRTCA